MIKLLLVLITGVFILQCASEETGVSTGKVNELSNGDDSVSLVSKDTVYVGVENQDNKNSSLENPTYTTNIYLQTGENSDNETGEDLEDPIVNEPEVDDPEIDDPEIEEPEVDDPEIDDPEIDDPEIDETFSSLLMVVWEVTSYVKYDTDNQIVESNVGDDVAGSFYVFDTDSMNTIVTIEDDKRLLFKFYYEVTADSIYIEDDEGIQSCAYEIRDGVLTMLATTDEGFEVITLNKSDEVLDLDNMMTLEEYMQIYMK